MKKQEEGEIVMIDQNILLKLKGISRNFGAVKALEGIDLNIYKGEVIALVGDNGSGKSTLIKIICGFHQPDKGEMVYEGKLVKWQSPHDSREKGIEVVYQDFALLPLMNVARNLFLGKEMTSNKTFKILNMQKMCAKTKEILLKLGIELHSSKLLVGKLSGGQRQSIAISRSLYFGTKLLILDEPTASLSIKETKIVLNTIKRAAEQGFSVIFISHNVSHVYSVADRFIALFHGKKVLDIHKNEISAKEIENTIVTGKKGEAFEESLI